MACVKPYTPKNRTELTPLIVVQQRTRLLGHQITRYLVSILIEPVLSDQTLLHYICKSEY